MPRRHPRHLHPRCTCLRSSTCHVSVVWNSKCFNCLWTVPSDASGMTVHIIRDDSFWIRSVVSTSEIFFNQYVVDTCHVSVPHHHCHHYGFRVYISDSFPWFQSFWNPSSSCEYWSRNTHLRSFVCVFSCSSLWVRLVRRQDETGRDRTGRDRTGQDGTGRDRTGRDRTGQDGTGRDRTGQDGTGVQRLVRYDEHDRIG